jgi:putative ABC transport system substrate-binding protein
MTTRRAFLIHFASLGAIGLIVPGTSLGADKIKVGILMTADTPLYVQAKDAAIQELVAAGFGPDRVVFDVKDAKTDTAVAAKIAKQFAADGVRLVITMGTTATSGVFKEMKDTPIVLTLVWDPVTPGFAKSWASSGNNVTGSSNRVPMASVLKTLMRLGPMKRLGVMFNPEEKNSVFQMEEIKGLQRELDFEMVEVPISKKDDPAGVVRTFAPRVNALYATGAVTVTSQMTVIAAVAAEHKIPTASHIIDTVEKGALLGVTANLQEVGKLAGVKAAQVLRGAKPSDVPIETLKRFDVAINMKTATATGIKIPVDLLQSATRVIR